MEIKGIIFDLDGTLVDSLMCWDIIWEVFRKRFSGEKAFALSPEDNKKIRTMPLKEAMEYIYSAYKIGKSGEELLNTANEVIESFYSNEVKLKNGVREFLEKCYSNGVKICIASATDTHLIKIAVRHCDIEKYFSKIFSCAQIGKGKEEPDIFLKALKYLGTECDETYVCEDSLTAIKTANALKLNTVGIFDKYNDCQEDIKRLSTIYVAEGETLEKLII